MKKLQNIFTELIITTIGGKRILLASRSFKSGSAAYTGNGGYVDINGTLTKIDRWGKTHNAGSIIEQELHVAVHINGGWEWFKKDDILVVLCELDNNISDNEIVKFHHLKFTKYDSNNKRTASIKKSFLDLYDLK